MADDRLQVELVYAEAHAATTKMLALAPGSRVADALRAAQDDPRFAQMALGEATVGIFGVVVAHDQRLHDGDRIEVYRQLADDPKSARRKRARSAANARR